MILKIRNSFFGKATSLIMVVVFLFTTFNPNQAYGLTGGPAQPEFNSFTPIGTSDMVDLASGDFTYNIPLMDIGGFPINLAYNSGVTMDDEASWVGLGWNLSIGQINRQMRGIPDDFEGDQMTYEHDMKNNYTVGASVSFSPHLAGVPIELAGTVIPSPEDNPLGLNFGLSAQYNSYSGFSLAPSAGVTYDVSDNASVGLSVKSDENGLSISPNISLHAKMKTSKKNDNSLGASIGVSFNSRQGLSSFNMSASRTSVLKATVKNKTALIKSSGSLGSSVSFLDNHYTPTIQDGLTSLNFTFNAALGSELFASEAQGQISAYGSTQFIPEAQKSQQKSAYGYDNNHLANNNNVRDFNREKDGNFSVNSTNLPLTNYTHDLYSVQGQGVSGMFRPYRSQVGYVSDNATHNSGGGLSAGAEFGGGNAFHLGVDIEVTASGSEAGVWDQANGNNALQYFDLPTDNTDKLYEEVYYKNVGDLAVDQESEMYGTYQTELGQYSPIRLKIDGDKFERTVEPVYEIKHNTNPGAHYPAAITDEFQRTERLKRNQNVLKVQNRDIITTDGALLGFISNTNAQPHHTAGFIVTRNDGARYIYGEALYNTKKYEVTFAAEGLKNSTSASTGLITYSTGDNSINNTLGDQYFDKIATPAYAHTYLLTCLLSSDYSDVDGVEGPSDGDFGSYTKFEYTNAVNYKWRVPYENNSANYNEGLKTDPTDDKGSYVYGEKEEKYLKKIETKTHIAIFTTSDRADGKGVAHENGGAGASMKRLDKISLYSKGEYYLPGTTTVDANAIPIKEVHFVYDYSLCDGVSNNPSGGGKLTLTNVFFTYRNSNMGQYSDYEFNYGDTNHDGVISPAELAERNPDYNLKGYDIWGNFKPNSTTGNGEPLDEITAPEFNYVDQSNSSLDADNNSAAWSITDILLPSGGKIEVDYEADDYQYVQDKKAMQNFQVVGAGKEPNPVNPISSSYIFTPNVAENALLFKSGANHNELAEYLYIALPGEDPSITDGEFQLKYLNDIIFNQQNLVQFRFMLNMNHVGGKSTDWEEGEFDYVSGYFKLDWAGSTVFTDLGVPYASIKMELVNLEGGFGGGNDVNPIAKSGWHFGRKYLPRFIYGLPDQDESASESVIVNSILQSVDNLLEVFQGANGLLRTKEIARRFIPAKSWIRLMNPNGHKKGGGCRVKKLAMSDEWAHMTSAETGGLDQTRDQKYGQEYDYTLLDGTSSGVATYEPAGSKENPLVQPVFVNEQRLLAPDEENYMEKPFGESFFPAPIVTYSRVSVKNLERKDDKGTLPTTDDEVVKKHATGYVVTEFYTSKDYPTITDQTALDVREDKNNPLFNLFNLNVKKHITVSQGYVVHCNDMNGKMKSQRVYAEGQDEYISGVDYIYDGYSTTAPGAPDPFTLLVNNEGKINNNVKTLSPDGKIEQNTLGVEYDIINDFREMKTTTEIVGVNGNVATFFIGFFPGIIPVPLPDYAHHEDKLDMVVTTKVINTFGIQREVIAHDAGASVYTRNLLWDSSTGEVLLTETVNEYGDKYYSLNFPAHWYYDGMGLACENSGAEVLIQAGGPGWVPFGTTQLANELFENGDEVIAGSGVGKQYAWVYNVSASGFNLMDEDGASITTINDGKVKIIRSGKRNIQSTSMASIVMMKNPLDFVGTQLPPNFLSTNTWNQYNIVNAGAVEFIDNWAAQCECGVDNTVTGTNPYRQNTKGVWRALRSHLFLTGRHQNTASTDPRNDGFYNEFSPFYYIDGVGNWHINYAGWTFTSEVTQFSPFGFELENRDALGRFSAAQYGYNSTFPLAVGANTAYSKIGFDGFEDYFFQGCATNEHFGFRNSVTIATDITDQESHTGNYSLKVAAGGKITKIYHLDCIITAEP